MPPLPWSEAADSLPTVSPRAAYLMVGSRGVGLAVLLKTAAMVWYPELKLVHALIIADIHDYLNLVSMAILGFAGPNG